jgi:hypothetical protein
MYTGSLDRSGEAHVIKLYYSPVLQVLRMHTIVQDGRSPLLAQLHMMSTFSAAPTSFSDAGMVMGSTLAVNVSQDGFVSQVRSTSWSTWTSYIYPAQVATEVVPRSKEPGARPVVVSRSVFATTAGALQLWRGPIAGWTRQEGLAQAQAVAFFDASDQVASTPRRTDGVFDRQLRQARALLFDAVHFATSAYSSARSVLRPVKAGETPVPVDWLRRTFGFRKLALVASPLGKLVALDLSAAGDIVWQRSLMPAGSDHSGARTMTWKALVPIKDSAEVLAVAELHDGLVRHPRRH